MAQKQEIGGSVFIWLDPIQRAILNDLSGKTGPEKRFLIMGPASTGKTVLIQLAVLRILEKIPDKNPDKNLKQKILIILPDDNLVKKYNNFFEGHESRDRILIGKISDEGVQKSIREDSPDIFIDEFSAVKIGNKTLVNNLVKDLTGEQLFCATMDFRQNMEFAGFGSPGSKNYKCYK